MSYLSQRQQYVSHRGHHSETTTIQFGVPQGSVLGPILFVLCTADVVRLAEQYGFSAHQYAAFSYCQPGNSVSRCRDLGACVDGVAQWMSSNCLQPNSEKTEFIWCVLPRRRHHLPTDQLIVQSTLDAPVSSVRDLGVHLDSDMSMHTHITQLACSCNGVWRQLRSIRRSLPHSALTTLVTSFIMSKFDYYNVALVGLPQYELDRVQSVVNATARLTSDARRYDHVTQLLMDLHWLRVPQRIQYKLCVLVYGCLDGTAPGYLSDLAVSVGSTARCQLRYQQHVGHQLETVRSPLQVHKRGTVYRQPSAQPPNRSLPSKKNLNRSFLGSHFGCDNVNFDYVKRSSNSLYRITALNKLS